MVNVRNETGYDIELKEYKFLKLFCNRLNIPLLGLFDPRFGDESGIKIHNRHITQIYLINKNIPSVPIEFSKLTHLSLISLRNVTFNPIFEERKKSAENNNVRLVISFFEQLSKIHSLKYIRFENCPLYEVPQSIIKANQLVSLGCYRCKVRKIPKDFGLISELKYLDLGDNLLDIIPNSIGQLKKLQILQLDKNKLTKIPKNIGNLFNLKELYLGGNQIHKFPDEISNLKNLVTISASDMALKEFPLFLLELDAIKEIYLHDNSIEYIPKKIDCLKNLCNLDLHSNCITSFPEVIKDMYNLNYLNLRNNKITRLPEYVSKFPSTLGIDLFENDVAEYLGLRNEELGRIDIIETFKQLESWNPDDLIKKIRNNDENFHFGKYHYKVRRDLHYILKKLEDMNNSAKEKFLSLIERNFSVSLKNSNYFLLL